MAHGEQLRLAEQCRVIIDDDRAGGPDGLVALAHHLLSPTNRVVAVTSRLLAPVFGELWCTAERGRAPAQELVDLIGGPARPAVHVGAEAPFEPGAADSAASEAIVTEARRGDDLPLFPVCAGPLSNVAAAEQRAPDIAARLSLVWVGRGLAPEAVEYNRSTDPAAAGFVFGRPELGIRQLSLETYRRCSHSVAELEYELVSTGRVGAWLWTRFLDLPLPDWVQLGGVWPLGDSPPVLLTASSDESSAHTATAGGSAPGSRRVHTDVDVRLIVGDVPAKLRLHESRQARAAGPVTQVIR